MKKSFYHLVLLSIFALIPTASSASSLSDGLVGYWALDGNAADSSGNGHDGTVIGATPTVDKNGNPSSAYSFDGNDLITVPDSSDFTLGSNPFSISAWSKLDEFTTDGAYYLMGHDEGPGLTNKWIFAQRNDGLSFVTSQTSWLDLGTFSFQVGDWHHLLIQRSGDLLSAYIDGALLGSAAFTAAIPDPATAFWIGDAEDQHPGRNFRGSIDDVRIYSRALAIDEIETLADIQNSVVPIPAAAWLFASALGVFGYLGKRKVNA